MQAAMNDWGKELGRRLSALGVKEATDVRIVREIPKEAFSDVESEVCNVSLMSIVGSYRLRKSPIVSKTETSLEKVYEMVQHYFEKSLGVRVYIQWGEKGKEYVFIKA